LSRLKAKALTVEGEFHAIEDAGKRTAVQDMLRVRHPHLEELISHSDAEVFSIYVVSFLLLEGPTDAYFEQIS
jgi:hypothetical protein